MSGDERIIQLLIEISKDLKEIRTSMKGSSPKVADSKGLWIDRLEVELLLMVSESTVKRFTAKGILKPKRIGRKNYYFKPDILSNRDRFLK